MVQLELEHDIVCSTRVQHIVRVVSDAGSAVNSRPTGRADSGSAAQLLGSFAFGTETGNITSRDARIAHRQSVWIVDKMGADKATIGTVVMLCFAAIYVRHAQSDH